MHRKVIPKDIHDEVVAKIKTGSKVAEMAEAYGISTKTIYGWLAKDSGEEVVSILQHNKLKKENEALKKIIGKLTLDMSWGKKRELVLTSECKRVVAQAMGISPGHLHRVSKQAVKDIALRDRIEAVWYTDKPAHPGYGPIRLGWHLKINHKRIARVMKQFNLHPPRRKSYRYCTKPSKRHHSYTNLIHNLVVTRSNQVWVYDVSFFWFQGGWWYLATIEDLFTRQIVASQVSRHHDRFLILSVSKQAVERVGVVPDIIHSDQGSEFLAVVVTNFWEIEQQVAISVSDTGSPWQNGYKESFFGHFKDDFGFANRFDSPGEFIAGIYEQIEYYNHDRLHRSLKMTPHQYAQRVSENSRLITGT